MHLKIEFAIVFLIIVSSVMLLPLNVVHGQSISDFFLPDSTGQSSNDELSSNIVGTNQTSGFSI
jgi:hypothetical protein